MLNFRVVMRFLVMSALLACALMGGCSDTPNEEIRGSRGTWGTRELPVVTAPVERAPLIDSIKSVGTARARQSVTLYPESSGVVTFAKLAPDTLVTKGETLLKLSERDQALAVRQAEV